MTIWKFQLQIVDCIEVDMPRGAVVLCVQVQSGTPCLWCLVEPSNKIETRKFRIYGTGHPIERNIPRIYIGTVQVGGGSLVFHVFEEQF
jgi:hypothetical protein